MSGMSAKPDRSVSNELRHGLRHGLRTRGRNSVLIICAGVSTHAITRRRAGRQAPESYASMCEADVKGQCGRYLFERFLAWCRTGIHVRPGTLTQYLSQIHVDMMYRCRDITAQCGWLSPQEWAPSVNRLVNDVTKTRVQAGQVIATNAAPFTETDWIIASNVLAELDNPKSFSLLFALNMGVLLMGRTSDVMMAKQTQQSLRLSTERGGTLDVRLLRVKTRETQVLPVAETMEPTPVRNLLNAYAYHMGVLGALAVGEQDEPFLFPDAVRAGNESAFFGGIFKEVYRVLDANGMRQHVTDGLTNHSLRNCGFTKALGHPQLSAASAAMYGGWSDQAWSRGRSGTSAAAKYHCYEQKELDRCARAVRGCHDLSLGGHHPTLPVFDHRWAATDWRRQVYDFGSLWCVSNERYVHPSMIAAMSASLHIWFDYWKRESGIGSYRCHCIRQ